MYALTTTTRILSLFKKKKIATFGRRCDDILMPTICLLIAKIDTTLTLRRLFLIAKIL